MPCASGISPETARAFYDRLVASQGADGCTIDDVSTERSITTIRWRSTGGPLPAAEVLPRSCADADATTGPTLAIRVPAEVLAACPSTAQAAVAIVQRESFGPAPARALPVDAIAVGAACVVVLAIVSLVESRRHRAIASP